MPGSTIAYQYIEAQPPQNSNKLNIRIENQDCLALAHSISEKTGKPVCVLNLANQFYVGGDYKTTTGGQEESLIRRTDLLESLLTLEGVKSGNVEHPYIYDLPNCHGFSTPHQALGIGEFTCLFSPDITVNRIEEGSDTPQQPFKINIISSAAYNLAGIDLPDPELYVIGTVFKIINQLRTAKAHGQRHLVLGAFGCGAFHNTPDLIAEIYHSVILEYEFQGCFDSINFSILTAKDGSHHNFNVFLEEFSFPTRPPLIFRLLKYRDLLERKIPELNMKLTPFLTIKSSDEFRFLVLRELEREIQINDKVSGKKSMKIEFIQFMIELINQYPKMIQELTKCMLRPEVSKNFYSAHSQSKLFKCQPSIVVNLQNLSQIAPSTFLFLNTTQKELAISYIDDFILAKSEEFIDCCQTKEDKKGACYLLYIACTQSTEVLVKNLQGQLTKSFYQIIIDLLYIINAICLGTSDHKILTSLIDPRIYDSKNTPEIIADFAKNVQYNLFSLLLVKYKDYFSLSECKMLLDGLSDNPRKRS